MHQIYDLNADEREAIEELIASIQKTVRDENELHRIVRRACEELPLSIRRLLADYRAEVLGPAIQISGFPVDDAVIGSTPLTTRPDPNRPIMREDIYLALIASRLGTPFSFASQQGGHLTQNIVPMKMAEFSQLGSGSKEELVWHTEDAFSEYRPDFILLFGMRNPQKAATTVACLPPETEKEDMEALFSKNFVFIPDPDHASHLAHAATEAGRIAHAKMQAMLSDPSAESVLFGNLKEPYIRIDPQFMKPIDSQDKSVAAYQRLVERIERSQRDVVIDQGDLLIVDNHRAVHGRRSFQARYDGSDRWLKKINVTQDFKRLSELRFHERDFAI
ncbi:TauD/TfdA family dioxygenase [Rhizobium paknamense]|uniref:Fe(II)/alpha-ketoglutarate-dependent arginine beta-hydroxylase n=1 Tax=Rhizobium paknamense TaxID=1206817 RepID=A0ABU0IAE5_9HYPH|nr:TauD/TfdA family dioxygenase [Rhizobium paknamense]MDQ0455203.1 Fe(II)/alpha-ketoglutarate-dependent arginine beta-hydroxylase [Rhizobium paknamense]